MNTHTHDRPTLRRFFLLPGRRAVRRVAWVVGATLLLINLYGLTQPLRMPGLGTTDHLNLRFIPDRVWRYDTIMTAIDHLGEVSDVATLADQANRIAHRSLVHVEWEQVDPVAYRQRIPIWENPYLYALGRWSDMPQINRYHFTDYRKSIERGIGICGDASVVLSDILNRYGIDNRILSFPRHVIVEYRDDRGRTALLDPDFGVNLNMTLAALLADPDAAYAAYRQQGYSEAEVAYLISSYHERAPTAFDGTYDFMTKRYWFERATYGLTWALPVTLIGFALPWGRWSRSLRSR